MNKGAVEFFSRGCRRCEQRWKKGGAVRDTDANRIERIGVETGHGFLYECLAWNNLGPIKGHGVAAGYQDCYRGSRMLGISWASDLYIYPLPGSLPVGPCPSRALLDLRQRWAERVEFVPTLRHVFSRWIRQNCWKLSSIRILFFLFSFCNKWMEVEIKYVRCNDRTWWKEWLFEQ